MPDNLNIKQPLDAKKVSTQPWEIEYWCKKFSCTEDSLRLAVKKVGHNPKDVNDYLN